jgi:hypothetical protein
MSQTQTNGQDGYPGYLFPTDGGSEFNATAFVIRQLIGRLATAMVVQVKSVTNSGGVSAVGFVDVQPLVNQIDPQGNSTPHGIIHKLPYQRLQGGQNAVIIDPQVGDIGVAVFASHDISSVKATKRQANPGSRRRFDWADGLYVASVLNGTPNQYIQFNSDGVTVISPTKVKIHSPQVEVIGDSAVKVESSTVTVTADALIRLQAPQVMVLP